MLRWIVTILVLYSFSPLVYADKKIILDKDDVIGNEESPKAMYIVPWRPLQPVGVAGLEIQSMLDEELALVDPETFKRKVELFQLKQAAKTKR